MDRKFISPFLQAAALSARVHARPAAGFGSARRISCNVCAIFDEPVYVKG
jgi:hypothetical protein